MLGEGAHGLGLVHLCHKLVQDLDTNHTVVHRTLNAVYCMGEGVYVYNIIMYECASVYMYVLRGGGVQTFNIHNYAHVKCQCPPQAEVYVL